MALVLFVGATVSAVLGGSQSVSAAGKLSPGERRCFEVSGEPGDVALVNLTPVQAEGRGYGLLVSSDVADVPVASNVNFDVGTTDPNVAAAAIGADGQVCYLNSEASSHVVADHLGSINSDAYTAAQANGAPLRKLDTRRGSPLAPGDRRCFAVEGSRGDVALVNLTPVRAKGRGFGLLVSSDVTEVPVASSVNFNVGTTDPNVAAAAIGEDGQVCYLNSEASTHLVADHLGTIDAAVYTAAQANGAPLRKLDTRGEATVAPGARRCFPATGSPGDVVLVNLTPVQAQGRGYGLLVSSDVTDLPKASNVNFAVRTTDPNVAAAAIGADGQVCYVNAETSTHLVADHLGTIDGGHYTPAKPDGASDRKIDTRPPRGAGLELVAPLASSPGITAMDCPTSSRCIALARGEIEWYTRVTSDGGANWTSSVIPDNPNGYISKLSCMTTNVCVGVGAAVAGDGGDVALIFRTEDAGSTWKRVSSAPPLTRLTWVDCEGSSCAAFGVSDRLGVTINSTDAGATWTLGGYTQTGWAPGEIDCPSALRCFAVGATGDNFSLGSSVVRSDDGGQTWQSVFATGFHTFLNFIECPTPAVCYAAGNFPGFFVSQSHAIMFRTVDGGETWTELQLPVDIRDSNGLLPSFASGGVQEVECFDAETCIFSAHEPGEREGVSTSVFVTRDGGHTWNTYFNYEPINHRTGTCCISYQARVVAIECVATTACFLAGDDDGSPGPGGFVIKLDAP